MVGDESFKFKRILDNSGMPEEYRKDYHNLNLEHQGHQPKQMFVDNWLEQRRLTRPWNRRVSYNEVVRQMKESKVLVKTTGKKEYDSPLDLVCKAPFLTPKNED